MVCRVCKEVGLGGGAIPVGSNTGEECGRPSGIGSCSGRDSQTPSAGSAGSPVARAGRGSDRSGSSCPSDQRRTDQWAPPLELCRPC